MWPGLVADSSVQSSAQVFGRACALPQRRRPTQRSGMRALLPALVLLRALGGADGLEARAQADDTEAFARDAYVTLVTTPAYAVGAETLAKVSRYSCRSAERTPAGLGAPLGPLQDCSQASPPRPLVGMLADVRACPRVPAHMSATCAVPATHRDTPAVGCTRGRAGAGRARLRPRGCWHSGGPRA